jgi:hypothetical protein
MLRRAGMAAPCDGGLRTSCGCWDRWESPEEQISLTQFYGVVGCSKPMVTLQRVEWQNLSQLASLCSLVALVGLILTSSLTDISLRHNRTLTEARASFGASLFRLPISFQASRPLNLTNLTLQPCLPQDFPDAQSIRQ